MTYIDIWLYISDLSHDLCQQLTFISKWAKKQFAAEIWPILTTWQKIWDYNWHAKLTSSCNTFWLYLRQKKIIL